MSEKDNNKNNCGQCTKDLDERFMLIGVYSMIQTMKVSEGLAPESAISAITQLSDILIDLCPEKKRKLLKSIEGHLPENLQDLRPLKKKQPKTKNRAAYKKQTKLDYGL